MGESFQSWVFPERMRFLSGSRVMSIVLRTLHLAAFGMLLGGHAFALDGDRLIPYLWVTIVSGLGLIALEIYAVGLYWLFLGKGIMVLIKLGLLLLGSPRSVPICPLATATIPSSIGGRSGRKNPFAQSPSPAAPRPPPLRLLRRDGGNGGRGDRPDRTADAPKERRSDGHLGPA
jgi:hypothetical protein